jgi:predicted nuclease of predicted toxin-antitoxin system
VKFLVDAQLPVRLVGLLRAHGHDALHTSALPEGNRSTDTQVAAAADDDGRVVVSKDSDFRDSHLLAGTPKQLLVVATGNITNNELIALFERFLELIVESLSGADHIELRRDALIVHERQSE